jgi:hypothetical protein
MSGSEKLAAAIAAAKEQGFTFIMDERLKWDTSLQEVWESDRKAFLAALAAIQSGNVNVKVFVAMRDEGELYLAGLKALMNSIHDKWVEEV